MKKYKQSERERRFLYLLPGHEIIATELLQESHILSKAASLPLFLVLQSPLTVGTTGGVQAICAAVPIAMGRLQLGIAMLEPHTPQPGSGYRRVLGGREGVGTPVTAHLCRPV